MHGKHLTSGYHKHCTPTQARFKVGIPADCCRSTRCLRCTSWPSKVEQRVTRMYSQAPARLVRPKLGARSRLRARRASGALGTYSTTTYPNRRSCPPCPGLPDPEEPRCRTRPQVSRSGGSYDLGLVGLEDVSMGADRAGTCDSSLSTSRRSPFDRALVDLATLRVCVGGVGARRGVRLRAGPCAYTRPQAQLFSQQRRCCGAAGGVIGVRAAAGAHSLKYAARPVLTPKIGRRRPNFVRP